MNTYPMKRVTIVCEAYAKEAVKKLLREIGAHGYTIFDVEGAGSRGERPGDIREFANIQVEVILPLERADVLLQRLEKEFFSRYAMIAYDSDVRVLRENKF
jgi:nitrogen regulatory protein PII